MVATLGTVAESAYPLADEARAGRRRRPGSRTWPDAASRSLRLARGWTLDELARRSNIGASTISRIETGHRRLAVDDLADLARALETTVDELLADDRDDDVVIRPVRSTRRQRGRAVAAHPTRTIRPGGPWPRCASRRRRSDPTPQIHPGRDWFYVLEGTARLVLGDREHLVEAGQAAEFDTMTPHWIAGYGGAGRDPHDLRPPR